MIQCGSNLGPPGYKSHTSPPSHVGPQEHDDKKAICSDHCYFFYTFKLFPKRQILDSSKVKEYADDNSKFDENGVEFSKRVENNVGKEKLLVSSNLSFFYTVFKKLVFSGRHLKTRASLGKR